MTDSDTLPGPERQRSGSLRCARRGPPRSNHAEPEDAGKTNLAAEELRACHLHCMRDAVPNLHQPVRPRSQSHRCPRSGEHLSPAARKFGSETPRRSVVSMARRIGSFRWPLICAPALASLGLGPHSSRSPAPLVPEERNTWAHVALTAEPAASRNRAFRLLCHRRL